MSAIPEERKQKIRQQLDRVLSSAAFSGSERHRRFLRFVVEEALKGETDKLNEFVLGFEVFNKNESFDPRIDSIVRVEARRLRERLKKYYEEEGRGDPVVITLRPRSFVPEFEEPSAARSPVRAHHHRTAMIALAGILLGAAVTATVLWFHWRRPPAPASASLLVLPFQNLSPAPGQEALGDALADAIITRLAGSPGLRVISRGSGIEFKASGRSPYQFAADLQVDYIVEGSVEARADRVRVSAKMTDVRTQSYVWAETREALRQDLPRLEGELTGAISSRIRIPLPPGADARLVRRRPANWQSYAAFLKGQYYWYQQERGSVEKSVALFEEALQGDPNYAPAWAWLSQAYQLMIIGHDGRDAAMIAKGRQAAHKALALDDQLAEAHAAVASYAALDWDWPAAEREFRRAIELNPGWAQGHMMYALLYLAPNGKMRPAMREMLHAHELDPLTRTTRSILADMLYLNRDYARAIAESEDLRRASPSPGDRIYFLSLSLSGQGKRALAEVSQAVSPEDNHPGVALLGYLLAKHGDWRQARAIQKRMLTKAGSEYVSPVGIALVSVGLGDLDETFRQLQRAVDGHVPTVCQVAVDPVFDPLRNDPRYPPLIQAIGLSR